MNNLLLERISGIMAQKNYTYPDSLLASMKAICKMYGLQFKRRDMDRYMDGTETPTGEMQKVFSLALGVSESWLFEGFNGKEGKEENEEIPAGISTRVETFLKAVESNKFDGITIATGIIEPEFNPYSRPYDAEAFLVIDKGEAMLKFNNRRGQAVIRAGQFPYLMPEHLQAIYSRWDKIEQEAYLKLQNKQEMERLCKELNDSLCEAFASSIPFCKRVRYYDTGTSVDSDGRRKRIFLQAMGGYAHIALLEEIDGKPDCCSSVEGMYLGPGKFIEEKKKMVSLLINNWDDIRSRILDEMNGKRIFTTIDVNAKLESRMCKKEAGCLTI